MKKNVYGFLLGLLDAAGLFGLVAGLTRGLWLLAVVGAMGLLAGVILDKRGREIYG